MDNEENPTVSPSQPPPSPEDTGSSHVSQHERPPHSTGFPWSSWPSVHVVQTPSGQYSPRTDERCLTYCSQSSRGRAEGSEPWCRSICIRRVFAHEVNKVIAHDENSKPHPTHSQLFPLPPEGQPNSRPRTRDPNSGIDDEGHSSPQQKPEDTRYWEEGWYLWTSKSRWAAQEKYDLMMCNLRQQDEWQRFKADKSKQQGVARGAHSPEQPDHSNHDMYHADGNEPSEGAHSRTAEDPFKWMAWQESTLLHLPPRLPSLYEPLSNLLSPTFRVLQVVRQSFDSGAHAQLAERMWEKARSPDPFVLARNVCVKMWEKWKEGPPDDADSEF